MNPNKQLNVTDFRYGLDSRRSELTSRSGVLLECNNAHITQGAEVEKRKAFVKTNLPNNSFGLLPTTDGLLIFGSALAADLYRYGPITITSWITTVGGCTLILNVPFASKPSWLIFGLVIVVEDTGSAMDGLMATVVAIANAGGFVELLLAVGHPASTGTGGNFIVLYGALPSPFIYQQLSDPNEGFAELVVTAAYQTDAFNVAPPFLNVILGTTPIPLSGNASYVVDSSGDGILTATFSVPNPGVPTSSSFFSFLVTGTGDAHLDNLGFGVISVSTTTNSITLVLFRQTLDTPGYTNNAIAAINCSCSSAQVVVSTAGVLPANFGPGTYITCTGFSSAAAILNGIQQVIGFFTTGGVSYITLTLQSLTLQTNSTGLGSFYLGTGNGNDMTEVVAACLFNGFPFVVAKYVDGDVGIFYNGQLVNDFFNGAVFDNATSNDNLAFQLGNYINATTGYSASVNGVVVTATSVNPTDSTKATPGGNFTLAFANNTVAGTLSQALINTSVASIAGEAASASFTIVAGQSGGNITGVYRGGSATTNLLSASVPWNTSVNQTAADVVTNINANAGAAISSANGGTVIVLMSTTGSISNDNQLTVTTSVTSPGANVGGIMIDNCSFFIDVGSTGHITPGTLIPLGGSDITNGFVTASTGLSAQVFAGDIATAINNYTGTSGWVACTKASNGPAWILYISRATVNSLSTSGSAVYTWTPSSSAATVGNIGTSNTNANFKATLNKKAVSSLSKGQITVGGSPTNSVTAIPFGGIGPYSYQWNYFSGSPEVSPLSPNSPTTNFESNIISTNQALQYATGNAAGGYKISQILNRVTAKFTCTVTDTTTKLSAVTPPVTVTAAYITSVAQTTSLVNTGHPG